ncbi:hypothetical protein ACTHQN_09460 [Curtobacterium flaccumfaciens]|jgi:hypothetical protein|uniref:hypothetical protein n=1 Tax=Curtobacterium flaccumfaciens TaxID=2035 RepID=UPI003F7E5413
MGIHMGESYSVDRAASARTVADVRTAAAGVSRHAEEFERALDGLAGSASGTPAIAAALRSFASARTGTAMRIGTHLQAVSAIGAIALAAVDEADDQMARTADHAAER